MNECLYIKEDESINDLDIGDVIELPMVVKGIEMRPDYQTEPLKEGEKPDEKEYKFYKLEYATDDDDDESGDDDLKKVMKAAASKAKPGDDLQPLPSKQTPYVGDSKQ